MKTVRLTSLLLAAAAVFLLAGCASTLPIHLRISQPAAQSPPPGTEAVLIEPFTEKLSLKDRIGEFTTWMNRRDIEIAPGAAGAGLAARVHRLLADRSARRNDKAVWDRSIAGMSALPHSLRLVVAGTIKDMRLVSTKKIMHTVHTLELEVECLLGQPEKRTVTTRQVQVALDTTKPLQREEDLEELINQGLDEAARKVVSEVGVLVGK